VAAAFGIDAWRRRMRGATEYKVALKILEAVFALPFGERLSRAVARAEEFFRDRLG